MKTCKNCGAQVPDEKNYCGACGYRFNQENAYSNSQSQYGGGQNFSRMAGNIFTDGADRTSEFDPEDIAANKIYAIIACFGILFFVPLVAAPQSRYGRFYANQSLLLLITSAAISVATGIISTIFNVLGFIFILFSIFGTLICAVLMLIPFALFIILLINAASGRAKELPVIGKYTLIK